jgi:hypothetical protein
MEAHSFNLIRHKVDNCYQKKEKKLCVLKCGINRIVRTILEYLAEFSYRHSQPMTQANDSKKPSFTHKELSTYSITMGISEELQ